MDTNTFNNQHVIISSMNDQVMDEFFDTKLFLPEGLSSFSAYTSSSPHIHQIIPNTNMNNVTNNAHVPVKQQFNSTNVSTSNHYASPGFVSQTIAASSTSSAPQMISFGNPTSAASDYGDKYYYEYTNNPLVFHPQKSYETAEKFSLDLANTPSIHNHLEFTLGADMGYNRRRTSPIRKTPQQAQYHVEAERKRREKLSSLFISLSKVVPGLKKWDKASVLEDAIKHMKELQERLTLLEEEVTKKNSTRTFHDHENDSMEDTCITSTCTMYQTEASSFAGTFNNGTMELQMPDVKARILGKNVLIKILCDKKYYGCTLNMTNELQKLHLAILDTRVLLFGGCAIDITFACQFENQFSTTANGIIEHLQTAIFQVQK